MKVTVKNLQNNQLVASGELSNVKNILLLGRGTDCDLILPSNAVSRKHARLLFINDMIFVEDLGSTGGTKVNNTKVSEMVEVSEADRIQIANFVILLGSSSQVEVLAANSSGDFLEPKQPKQENLSPQPKNISSSTREVNNFLDEFKNASILYENETMQLKRSIHEEILDKLNWSEDQFIDSGDNRLMQDLEITLDQVLKEHRHELPVNIPFDLFRQALKDELVGFGPITPLLRSPKISEIMINGPDCIFIESSGRLYESGVRFFSNQHLLSIIQRIVEPLGRHIDDASPMVDARLPDGSRVNAVIPPLALHGASVTIRKFADKKLTTDDLINFGSMTQEMALFLEEAVRARKNILVSGGTGSGKTTLLNVLSLFIPAGERVITVEDSAELKLTHKNLVSLEARPANIEGKGRISIRDLVINTLRMRPDRIIVGECRGAEALDMLQAMNTGHDGSLTTCHANNPRDALSRMENMVMMAGFELPSNAIREQIASAVDIIVQQSRLSDGSRKILQITEITGKEQDVILLQDIFEFVQTGIDKDGKVQGYHTATGNIPYFVDEMRKNGSLRLDMSVFVPKS